MTRVSYIQRLVSENCEKSLVVVFFARIDIAETEQESSIFVPTAKSYGNWDQLHWNLVTDRREQLSSTFY